MGEDDPVLRHRPNSREGYGKAASPGCTGLARECTRGLSTTVRLGRETFRNAVAGSGGVVMSCSSA